MSTSLLLSHLQNKEPKVSPATLFAALAHHLAQDQPTPTSIAASAVSAPFFLQYPPSFERIQGLVTAFQHATLLKHEALVKGREESSTFNRILFSPSVTYELQLWVEQAHSGLRGGRPLFRLAACSGMLLGMNYIKGMDGKARGKVENDIAVALAEVLDDYTVKTGDWEKEFSSGMDETTLSLTLMVTSQSLHLLPAAKLDALPLGLLASLLASSICASFAQGNFLQTQSDSQPGSKGALAQVASSPAMGSMSTLSKLLSLVLGILVTSEKNGLEITNGILAQFNTISKTIEQGWLSNPLATSSRQDAAAPDSEDTARMTWTVLKTFLFAIVMILDGVLGNVVYRTPDEIDNHQMSTTPHLSLQILSHLSFVISQFGGVTATYSGDTDSFTELNKVFYLALDILNSGQSQKMCETFIEALLADLSITHEVIRPEKTAFVFACIEQCVPRLGMKCIEKHVLVACIPYLSDPSNREIYESAHSVVLAIFATHALRSGAGEQKRVELPDTGVDRPTLDERRQMNVNNSDDRRQSTSGSVDLIHRMVPFYAKCLLENSQEGMLSTPQLRLAYTALVKGACSGTNTSKAADGSLGWYCINLLIDQIKSLQQGSGQEHEARLHRLRLTLVSAIPSLPFSYLVPALEQVRSTMKTADTVQPPAGNSEQRKELVEALFRVIQDEVGDAQKSVAMQWWYENRENFGLVGDENMEKGKRTKSHDPAEMSRL